VPRQYFGLGQQSLTPLLRCLRDFIAERTQKLGLPVV
jgi:hypothetical protein